MSAIEAAKHTPGPWMSTTNRISEGALRAGREIAARFRLRMPRLPVSSDLTLAAIIEAETHAGELLEALQRIVDECSINGSPSLGLIDIAEAAIRKTKGEL